MNLKFKQLVDAIKEGDLDKISKAIFQQFTRKRTTSLLYQANC